MAYIVRQKMKHFLAPLCLASILAVFPIASAATVSISQPTFTGLADYAPTGFGQSFTANGDYSIVAIDLYISASSGGSDATLRIYDFNSSLSTLGPTVLGTGTFLETQLSTTPAWIRVNLSSPIAVSNSSEYAFTIIAKDPGGSATGWNNYGVNSANVYAEGSRLNISSSSGAVSQGTPDLAFAVITVPEPSSFSLFALGVIAATNRRTRRRS